MNAGRIDPLLTAARLRARRCTQELDIGDRAASAAVAAFMILLPPLRSFTPPIQFIFNEDKVEHARVMKFFENR